MALSFAYKYCQTDVFIHDQPFRWFSANDDACIANDNIVRLKAKHNLKIMNECKIFM